MIKLYEGRVRELSLDWTDYFSKLTTIVNALVPKKEISERSRSTLIKKALDMTSLVQHIGLNLLMIPKFGLKAFFDMNKDEKNYVLTHASYLGDDIFEKFVMSLSIFIFILEDSPVSPTGLIVLIDLYISVGTVPLIEQMATDQESIGESELSNVSRKSSTKTKNPSKKSKKKKSAEFLEEEIEKNESINFEDSKMQVIEQVNSIIEQTYPIIEQANPIIEQANPIIEQVNPIIEKTNPIIELANPIIEKAISNDNLPLGQENARPLRKRAIPANLSNLFDLSNKKFGNK